LCSSCCCCFLLLLFLYMLFLHFCIVVCNFQHLCWVFNWRLYNLRQSINSQILN
jgi:hypothetical protein